MENYFGINYEFDYDAVLARIDRRLADGGTGYICVSDGVILNTVHRSAEYRRVVQDAMCCVCDSSYVPLYIKWIYKQERSQLSGTELMRRIVESRRYRMAFIGGSQDLLDALRPRLARLNPDVEGMHFEALPFCHVNDFDYEGIAARLNAANADVVFVSLGAPKQEIFMNRLVPHLERGVAIATGAAFKFHAGIEEKRARTGWCATTWSGPTAFSKTHGSKSRVASGFSARRPASSFTSGTPCATTATPCSRATTNEPHSYSS